MAGKISEEDIALVREKSDLAEIVSQYVQLRPSGGGSWVGLCPFHDEKTASFQVSPARGLYYCFGCGEGGDVITFLEKIANLSFVEAVTHLADRSGIQLRLVNDGSPSQPKGLRQQVLAANQAAAEFFAKQLLSPEGLPGRQMLDGRGFDRDIAQQFSVGYAPKSGRVLHQYLNKIGFSDEVLINAGLIRSNGGWDFFQGRVIWPIKDSTSTVLGFGARRLFSDDRLPAKYINTPETVVYKKSNVLYGLDLARKNIGAKSEAVVMEGYTDVMAAHLSGVDTAVASCGTAFGAEHAKLLLRLIGGGNSGKIIFTFDGDEAGRKAALKVFGLGQAVVSKASVALVPDGLDPCDLRLKRGEQAVRDLIAHTTALPEFVMRHMLKEFDLNRSDQRVDAVRAVVPIFVGVQDQPKLHGYIRDLAGFAGVDVELVQKEFAHVTNKRTQKSFRKPRDFRHTQTGKTTNPEWGNGVASDGESSYRLPDKNNPKLLVERGTLKLMLQYPLLFDQEWNGVQPDDFMDSAYRRVVENIQISPPPNLGNNWLLNLLQDTQDPIISQLQNELAVEEILRSEPDEEYVLQYTNRLLADSVSRHIAEKKSKISRIDQRTQKQEFNTLFSEILQWENYRKELLGQSEGDNSIPF